MIGYIYYIINNTTNKRYVGITTDYKRRWNKHKSELRRNCHHSSKLQNAWNKYGEEDFIWFKKEVTIEKYEDLLELEIKEIAYYDSYNNGYNCTIGGELPPRKQKVKDENIVDFLCINSYYGDGYGKTCEEIFGWSKGTASSAKRKIRYFTAIDTFAKMSQQEINDRAIKVFNQYRIDEVALNRQLTQGGAIQVYKLTKEDYYFAFAAKELGYTCKQIANFFNIKEGTVKDWGRRHRIKELEEFNNLTSIEKEKIIRACKNCGIKREP
jgi:predicted GIY-YIG superfamily endonuclease/ribosomal protein S26